MEILLLSVVFPHPVNAGGSSGTFKIIDHLRKHHKITFIGPFTNEKNLEGLKELWPEVEIHTFMNSSPPSVDKLSLGGMLRKLKPKPKSSKEELFRKAMVLETTNLTHYFFHDLIEITLKLAQKKHFDLIQVDFIELAPIVNFLPKHTPKIFVHHEIRHKRMELEFNTLNKKNLGDLWKIRNIRLLEIALLNKYDQVVALTPDDRDFLLEDGVDPNKIKVSPLPATLKDHPINQPFTFKNKIVFLGPSVHFPNLDAVDWFLTYCWKDIKSRIPQFEFDIIGNWDEEKLEKLPHSEGVNFLGFVENLDDVMEGAIMVVPLRIGSGMRMKILEGITWHVPIVSTSIGAEGLPMKNGINCFIADQASSFVKAILQLAQSPSLQTQFIENSKQAVKNGFSPTECGLIREKIWLEINHSFQN